MPATTRDATLTSYHPGTTTTTSTGRIASVDVVRGIVMVLMAIDHVRVYSGVPAGGTDPAVFFTRWVTNFSAPAFAFFAGTSAYLLARKLADRGALSRFLFTRGLLLVAMELTLIRFAWTANLDFPDFMLAGVIWMLGWSMVIMAGAVRLRPKVVGWLGVAMVALQQVFAVLPRVLPQSLRNDIGPVYEFFYPAGLPRLGVISILYVIIPWVGVMAAGYGFGGIITREAKERDRLCLRIGLGMTVAFLLLATLAAVVGGGGAGSGGSQGGGSLPLPLRVLAQGKYPPTQLFLLMTLGPTIAIMPWAERARGVFARVMAVFGRVPMFFYIMHIALIHVMALVVNFARTGAAHSEWYVRAPFAEVPAEQRWSLGVLYLVFVVAVAVLYPLCRWYAGARGSGRYRWMRYV